MALILETENFLVEAPDQPLVGREDGGHVVISPKIRVSDIQQLAPLLAIELMRLLQVTGEAMASVMNKNGVDIGRINYQDNGNWGVFLPEGPYQHFHLYGRARSAKTQRFGQSCYFPHKEQAPDFYRNLQPLAPADIADMKAEMHRLMKEGRYAEEAWGLIK